MFQERHGWERPGWFNPRGTAPVSRLTAPGGVTLALPLTPIPSPPPCAPLPHPPPKEATCPLVRSTSCWGVSRAGKSSCHSGPGKLNPIDPPRSVGPPPRQVFPGVSPPTTARPSMAQIDPGSWEADVLQRGGTSPPPLCHVQEKLEHLLIILFVYFWQLQLLVYVSRRI